MCKQHLNALSVMARSLERLGLGQRPGNVTSLLVNATRDPAERCLWTALRLEQAGTTVARACQIKKCFPVIEQFAGETLLYLASTGDCRTCLFKAQCCPKTPFRRIPRSIYEEARDVARALAKTEAFERSRHDRKRVEMLFAHLKRILRLGRLRLRGPRGAQFEFTLAAIAQNLRRLAKLVPRPPPLAAPCVG